MTEGAAKPLRSQETRDRILTEARRLFAEQGFENTTIRAIASAAKINPSMVIRYYRSKEELFATAAEIEFRVPDLTALAPSDRGEALVRHILDRWEGPDSAGELQVLLRAAGTHELARNRLVALVEEQAAPAIRRVLPKERRKERLGLIIIQLTGLVLSRYFLKHPSVKVLDREVIIAKVGAIVQAFMTPDSDPGARTKYRSGR